MNFNDTQKKWAMTGVLLAVLGFNISPPKSMKSFSLIDMASTAEVESIRFSNDGSEYLGDLRKSGDDLIVNVGKLQKTESGAMILCTKDCGRTILLPNAVGTKTEDIKLLLQKAMDESQESEETTEVAKSDRGSARVKAVVKETDEKMPRESRKKLARDEEKTTSKSVSVKQLNDAVEECKDTYEDTAEIAQCISDGTVSIFEDLDKKEIDSDKVTSILTKEMILPLGEELSNIRDDEQFSYANRNMMMAKMKEVLKPLSSLMNNSAVSKSETAKALKERYNLLVKASLQDAKAAWDNKDLNSFQYRSDDLKMWSSYMAGSNIYNKGMNEANQMSANLQNQIAVSLCSITNASGCGTATGNDQVIQVNGQIYTRVDAGANRGGATGQMTTTNVSAVPQVILQQPAQSGMQIVVPTTPSGTYNSLQPMSSTTVNGVPVQVIQQQVVPSTPQYYQQPQQMYSQPTSQFSVPQSTTGGVVNMGTLRTGGTTTGGVVNMGGTRY